MSPLLRRAVLPPGFSSVLGTLKEAPTWKLLGSLFVIALAVRMAVALLLPIEPLRADSLSYHLLAESLLEGRGFRLFGDLTARRPPGYPVFLAAFYGVLGPDRLGIRVIQVVLSSVTVLLVYRIGMAVYGRVSGLGSAFLVTFHPPLLELPARVLSETLFIFLLAASVAILVGRGRLTLGRGAAAGLVLGLAVLTRPVPILLPIVLLVIVLCLKESRSAVRAMSAFLVVAVLVVSPWSIRNAIHFDHLVPVSTGFGANVFVGSHPPFAGRFPGWSHPELVAHYGGYDHERDPIEVDRRLMRAGVRNIVGDPVGYLALMPVKAWRLIQPTPETAEGVFGSPILLYLAWGYHMTLLTLALVGLLWPRRWGTLEVLLLAVVLYWAGFHVATLAVPRYLVPAVPFLAVFAGSALGRLGQVSAGIPGSGPVVSTGGSAG